MLPAVPIYLFSHLQARNSALLTLILRIQYARRRTLPLWLWLTL